MSVSVAVVAHIGVVVGCCCAQHLGLELGVSVVVCFSARVDDSQGRQGNDLCKCIHSDPGAVVRTYALRGRCSGFEAAVNAFSLTSP